MSGALAPQIWLPFLLAMVSTVLTTSSIKGATGKLSRTRSIFPASILDRSRMSLISAKKMAGRTLDTVKRLDLIVALEFARILLQHFGYADDGIERRAQFVRHVGEEAGFRAACLLRGVARYLELVHSRAVLDGEDDCAAVLSSVMFGVVGDDAAVCASGAR